jgi:hypothetical protein
MDEEEAIELIEGFKTCTLPKARWTHFAHLVVGLHMATAVSLEVGIAQMRQGIHKTFVTVYLCCNFIIKRGFFLWRRGFIG